MGDQVKSYESLALSRRPLTGGEIRILRRQINLSQSALAHLFGVKELTVARWEKQQIQTTMTAEALLRLLYLEMLGKPVKVVDMLDMLARSQPSKDNADE